VPSARRFYFFIRSVRAFGTTQSLLFISFTKPSMTTLHPAVSEANMIDTCKHFEIGSGSGSHLSVFVIEHLCRVEDGTNTKQIKLSFNE
jgi:hypothetical protein